MITTFAGVFLAWGSGGLFGTGPLAMGVMLVVAPGAARRLRDKVNSPRSY